LQAHRKPQAQVLLKIRHKVGYRLFIRLLHRSEFHTKFTPYPYIHFSCMFVPTAEHFVNARAFQTRRCFAGDSQNTFLILCRMHGQNMALVNSSLEQNRNFGLLTTSSVILYH